LNLVIERYKQGLSPIPDKENHRLLFWLSPNDLVYLPTMEEMENPTIFNPRSINKDHLGRIYKMVSSSGIQCFFLKAEVATSIYNKFEYSALNKMERSIDGLMIKEHCWKLKVSRLGFINDFSK